MNKNKSFRKLMSAVVATLAVAFKQPANFANAEPGGDPTGSTQTTKAVAVGDPGKGTSPDPGTGKTVDYRKMVCSMLGLDDAANEEMVNTAYKTCMATEPDEDDKAIKGKISDATLAKNDAETKLSEAEKLAANEKTAREAAEKTAADNLKRAELAEAAFANERNAHSKAIVSVGLVTGKITKAESEAKETLLANAKTPEEFDTLAKEISNSSVRINVASSIGTLGRTIAPGTASQKYLDLVQTAMANEAKVEGGRKHDYNWHWSNIGKTEEGKSLLADMRQPTKAAA